jgi:deoxyribodipyrimidine photolyase-related protein
MTRTLHLVMPDQLSQSLSALRDYNPAKGVVLMCETMAEATNVPHHKKNSPSCSRLCVTLPKT